MSLGDIGAGAGQMGGGIAVLAGLGGKSGKADYNKAVQVMQQLRLSDFDTSQVPYEDLQVFAEYFPEAYQAVVPDEVKLAMDSPEARAAQSRSLATLEDIRDNGMGLQDRLSAQQIGREMQGEASAASRGVARDMAQRGRYGGGEALFQQQMAAQNAADMANQMGTQLAQQAMANRMTAANQAGSMAGQMRQGDINLSSLNADYANRFNEMSSGRQNQAAQQNAQWANQAAQQRAQQRQDVGTANQQGRMANRWQNLTYGNQLKGDLFNQAYQKATGLANAYTNRAQAQDRYKAQKDESIMGIGEGVGRAGGGVASMFGGGFF